MYNARVRNPETAMIVAVQAFFSDPAMHGAKLARIARQEHYGLIQPYVQALYEQARDKKDKTALAVATMLRQPEWVWRSTNNPEVRLFGFHEEDSFVASGYYVTGRMETGETRVFKQPGDTGSLEILEACDDPRLDYEARSIRHKVWKCQNRYWVVAVGRVIDLIKAGIDRRNVELSKGKGYFKKVPAYSRVKGPFSTPDEAREARATL